jgi:hypothetical protein
LYIEPGEKRSPAGAPIITLLGLQQFKTKGTIMIFPYDASQILTEAYTIL